MLCGQNTVSECYIRRCWDWDLQLQLYISAASTVAKLSPGHYIHTDEPVYNDTSLHDTSPIESEILWYQLIRHC
jgi:hypothetical protein